MRKTAVAIGVCLLFSLSAWAQEKGNVAEAIVTKPKAGHTAQYEAGRKRHMAFHKKQNDTFSWMTYEILSGDNTGSYVTVSPNHEWKDFDGREKFDAADSADVAINLTPHAESTTVHYYVYRPDMSNPPEGNPEPVLVQTTHFYVRPEGQADFVAGVRKITEAGKKTNSPGRPMWYQLVSGGEGPRFVLRQLRKNWAEFQPPDKTLDAMVEEAFGKEEAEKILSHVRKNIRYTVSYTSRYRPDLSYVPAAQ
ncbi:MAG: hypothetical protein ACRD24_07085 [Terriglobales bacterium]